VLSDLPIAQPLTVVAFFIIGIRLLRLSRRTKELPELLLATYFLSASAGYAAWSYPLLFDIKASWEVPIDLIGWWLFGIGILPFLLFVRSVFRPGAKWATGIAAFCTISYFTGLMVWSVNLLSFSGYEDYYTVSSPWFWSIWLGYAIPDAWMSIEAFKAFRNANRRAQLGLCDAIVANRYLLFGLFAGFQLLTTGAGIREAMDYASTGTLSAQTDLMLGGLEVTGIVFLFIAFFPPTAYLKWISGTQQGVDSPVEG
jgi:hypothetical protein